jgi:predicted metal-dependent peptidase
MENNKFEIIRTQLLSEVYGNDNFALNEEFNEKFFQLVDSCVFSLIEEKENFFAYFIIMMKRQIDTNIGTASASNLSGNTYIIYFNPYILLSCTMEEMKSVIKHEVYHIISMHHKRARDLRKQYSNLAVNLAMDISVNQYINKLPAWAEKLESVALSYNVDLREGWTLEKYTKVIQEGIDKLNKVKTDKSQHTSNKSEGDMGENSSAIVHDISTAHDKWNENQFEIDDAQFIEVTKKIIQNSIRGTIPKGVEGLINNLLQKPEISWKDYLRRMLGTIPSGNKKTITRKDRRQPERLELRGKLNRYTAHIVVAIDISGSMTDEEISKIMNEILNLVKVFPSTITIVECDSEIRRVYEVKKIKDVRQKLNTKGGTRYSPVFQHMFQQSLNNSILVYFTDGLGESKLSIDLIKHKTLWVLTSNKNKLSLINPPGIIKRFNDEYKEKSDILAIEYLKDEMKETRAEWAK